MSDLWRASESVWAARQQPGHGVLGSDELVEFHKALDKYIAVATKVGGARTRKPAHGSKEDLAAIRGWGRENGFKVSERGRVSSELKDAYSNGY